MAELPEICRWFASDEGERPMDFTIYVWRLLLELAQLLHPDREVDMTGGRGVMTA